MSQKLKWMFDVNDQTFSVDPNGEDYGKYGMLSFDLLLNYLGVAIFLGLTAWDTQRLKMIATGVDEEEVRSDSMRKYAIVGALQLYLDFINLFLLLLRLFGRGRD